MGRMPGHIPREPCIPQHATPRHALPTFALERDRDLDPDPAPRGKRGCGWSVLYQIPPIGMMHVARLDRSDWSGLLTGFMVVMVFSFSWLVPKQVRYQKQTWSPVVPWYRIVLYFYWGIICISSRRMFFAIWYLAIRERLHVAIPSPSL